MTEEATSTSPLTEEQKLWCKENGLDPAMFDPGSPKYDKTVGDDLDGVMYRVGRMNARAQAAAERGEEHHPYDPSYPRIAAIMCRGGSTDAELAEAFQVTTTTIWRWKSRYPEFGKATQEHKIPADQRVVQALYRRAVGYDYREEVLTTFEGVVTRNEIIKHQPPDVKAISIWLYNRDPDRWKQRKEITGKDGAPLIPTETEMNIKELGRRLQYIIQRSVDAEAIDVVAISAPRESEGS